MGGWAALIGSGWGRHGDGGPGVEAMAIVGHPGVYGVNSRNGLVRLLALGC